jgi:iron-sulfur cluster assembly protein
MIVFTEVASNKIIQQIKKRCKGLGIRIGIKTTGCSGLAYVLEYVDEYVYEENVTNFSQKDFIVLVSQKHLPYVQGMTVDYVRNGLNEGFEFSNPNERDRCGCGESFRI